MDDDSSLTSASADAELTFLNQFLAELRAAEGEEKSAVVTRHCRIHPELAGRFRKIAAGTLNIDSSLAASGTAPGAWGCSTGPGATALPLCFGPYRVVRMIGRGGMGEVYEAEEAQLNRHVAVKTTRRSRSTDRGMLERFDRRAACAGSAAPHPHRPDLCDGTGRRSALLRDAVYPGRVPRPGNPHREAAQPRQRQRTAIDLREPRQRSPVRVERRNRTRRATASRFGRGRPRPSRSRFYQESRAADAPHALLPCRRLDYCPGGRGGSLRASRRDHPPRLEALEYHGRAHRTSVGPRLRAGLAQIRSGTFVHSPRRR